MLPAYIANMMPVLVKHLPIGNAAINEKLFGCNKTYRGLAAGVLGGIFGILLQKSLHPWLNTWELLPYNELTIFNEAIYGILFGGGALFGDLLKSYFKRRLRIAPGQPWIPFDQLDFVAGSLIAMSLIYIPPLFYIFIIICITPILHLITNAAAYAIGIKKVWW